MALARAATLVTDHSLPLCRLMVATPMYAGAQGGYVRSAIALALAAQAHGMVIDFAFILHQPSITRARNMLAHLFLRSDFTHMLFLDDDVSVSPAHVLSMLAAMAGDERLAILGGPVPRRRINWTTVAPQQHLGLLIRIHQRWQIIPVTLPLRWRSQPPALRWTNRWNCCGLVPD